eukprot:10690033-Ditylum_brightwellii.AAC.1
MPYQREGIPPTGKLQRSPDHGVVCNTYTVAYVSWDTMLYIKQVLCEPTGKITSTSSPTEQ